MKTFDARWLLVACVILLTWLVAYRAVVIPVTHDEASTWLSFRDYNMWSCYENYFCWKSANNHWLNTMLMQSSADLFGDKLWALRLPNVVAGFLYFVAAALLSLRYIRSSGLQFTGFVLLTAHPYLLDFFSLFRGYGLMVCGVLWGIYFIMRYIEGFEIRWLIWCILSLSLAVLSNFTALLPMASVGCVWFVWTVMQKKSLLFFKHSLPWIFATAVLVWWSAYPIRILADVGEFNLGAKNIAIMMHNLFDNLLNGFRYFGQNSPLYYCLIVFVLISLVGVIALVTKTFTAKNQLLLVLVFLLINLGLVVANQMITESSAPVGRRTIYFIPILFVPLALGLNLIKHKVMIVLTGVVICSMFLYHTLRPHTWNAVREWYYDAYYPQLFSFLPVTDTGDSIRLGSSWIFAPSLIFYQKTTQLPISGLVYQKPLVIDSTMHYYYVEATDTIQMRAFGFVLQNNIGPFFLFRNIQDPIPLEAQQQ